MSTVHKRIGWAVPVTVVTGALLLAGCGSSGASSSKSGSGGGSFNFAGITESNTAGGVLKDLAAGPCKSEVKSKPLSLDLVAQTDLDEKLQLLAGQKALPDAFVAPNTPQLAKELIKAGDIADVSTQLKKDGESNAIVSLAASTIRKMYGNGDLYALPNELDIEGIWYNKKIFAEHDITVPTTWDELVADMAKLKAAGIQPLTADGQDGWPVTRWVGAYIFRSLGPDALQAVADGKAKLTDPQYVKAADAISQLGKDGYFGSSVASESYDDSVDQFLTGKAAMIYQGTWVLAEFDSSSDKIGINDIGFMRFPSVAGGKGNIDQLPANVGEPIMFSAKTMDSSASQAWFKCIVEHYADTALSKDDLMTGLKFNQSHKLSVLDSLVKNQIDQAKASVLWFEALFSAEATNVSQENGGLLGAGRLSGSEFMSKVQAALNASS